MNNLKRVLALSLAATSILSAAASASFADIADLDTESAISTLVALGVIKGYEDGTFRPEDTVTRAEMAKMIYTIKNGGNDASDLFVDVSTNLSDISGHWAEGYVKYCESLGIIAGRGDGKFYPEATVTGTEAIKMALVVLGYDADVSSLVGSSWDVNTLALGSTIGLTTGFVGSLSAGAQRQSAATVLYNALYADVVRYSGISEYYTSTGDELAKQAFNLETASNATIATSSSSTLTIDVAPNTLNGNLDLTAYEGLKVDILYNEDTLNVFGVKQVIGSTIVTDEVANVEFDADEDIITIKDLEVTFDTGVVAAAEAAIQNTNAQITVVDYDGRTTIDGSSATEEIIIKEVTVAEVTATSSTKVTLSAITDDIADDMLNAANNNTVTTTVKLPSSLDITKNSITDVEEDDIVQVAYNKYDGTYTVDVIVPQTGTVDAIRSSTSEYRIDGVWYTSNQDATGTNVVTLSLNEEVDFWAVDSVIYAKETIVASNNFAVVTNIVNTGGYFNNENYVELLTADGTVISGVADRSYINSQVTGNVFNTTTTTAVATGNIVSYRINAADEIVLYVDDATAATTAITNDIDFNMGTVVTVDGFNVDTSKFVKTVGSTDHDTSVAFVNDDATIFVTDKNNDQVVITGAQLKAWKTSSETDGIHDITTASSTVYAKTNTGGYDYVTLAHIVLADVIPGITADNAITGMIMNNPEEDANYDNRTVLKIWNGSENVTVYADVAHTAFAQYSYVTVLVDDDMNVDSSDITALATKTDLATKVTIKSATESEVTLTTGGEITVASDVVIFDNSDKGVAKTISDVKVTASIEYTTNSDGEIDVIIINAIEVVTGSVEAATAIAQSIIDSTEYNSGEKATDQTKLDDLVTTYNTKVAAVATAETAYAAAVAAAAADPSDNTLVTAVTTASNAVTTAKGEVTTALAAISSFTATTSV